jgi:hypothetical protein
LDGNLIWAAVYPASHQFATNQTRIIMDQYGDLYMLSVTGDGTHSYFVVLKYDSNGNQYWEYRYRPPNANMSVNTPFSFFVDSNLNIYVTGEGIGGSGVNSGFDIITIKLSQEIVPVELTSFTSNIEQNNISLLWTTATELNNMGFELFRNGNKIAFIEGKGTTTETQSYSYIDKNLTPGIYNYRLEQIDFDGSMSISGELIAHLTVPETFNLYQNYPNPFNPTTVIGFQLPKDNYVSLKVYDILGNEITTLINEEKSAGLHTIEFDWGSNNNDLSSGVYFYRLQAGDYIDTKKMILLR